MVAQSLVNTGFRANVQRVPWFHSWVIRFNEQWTFWIAYSQLTVFSHILPKPASCSRQFTQPSVRKIVTQSSPGKWSQFLSGESIKAAKHKLISFCSWPSWMITKANKDMANRKHTYLFYGNVNCTSKAKASVSHMICAWLSFQLSRIMFYCASFESYIRQNFGFSPYWQEHCVVSQTPERQTMC